jgi:uncharacterized RDD family membrane protein YckC
MSQVVEPVSKSETLDPLEIGWYIDSADEEAYGPVSRKTLRQFLEEGVISPNTLVRHCAQAEARPLADQPGGVDPALLEAKGSAALGDRLEEAWPRKKRDQQALAEDSLPCARHKKPAILMCVRCHAPYCSKCRAKPFKKQFYLCRKCQVGMHNRRFLALILDTVLLFYIPYALAIAALGMSGMMGDPATVQITVFGVYLVFYALLFGFGRDALFGGASPGKRMMGLRVVKTQDGETRLSYGQGVVRWLSQFIPVFNLVDAIAPYYDPLLRRYGDRWGKTRVLDSEKKLAKDRAKTETRLVKKGIPPLSGELDLSMTDLARLA